MIADDGLGRVWIETLNAEILLPEGIPFGKKKRIPSITAVVENTTGLYLQGTNISTQKYGTGLLDQPAPSITGNLQKRGFLGWDEFGRVSVTQREPAFLTLKALSYEVSVG